MEPPTVTLDNLLHFHSEHLPYASTPSFGLGPEQPEDEDELGYYPDGTKRTLTEEQIEIFRHSEIQDLIKLYNSEIADEDSFDASPRGVERSSSVSERLLKPNPVTPNCDQKSVESKRPAQPGSSLKGTDNHGLPKKGQKRKREGQVIKKPEHGEFIDKGQSRTHRRICRELDEQKSEDIELDY